MTALWYNTIRAQLALQAGCSKRGTDVTCMNDQERPQILHSCNQPHFVPFTLPHSRIANMALTFMSTLSGHAVFQTARSLPKVHHLHKSTSANHRAGIWSLKS